MTMSSNDINWKDYILPVAEDVFGEISSQVNHMVRFGAKGSKTVDLNSGTWYDFETGLGGGCISLLKEYYPDENPLEILKNRYGLEQNSPQNTPTAQPILTHRYDYTNEHGEIVYSKLKYEPKDFRWKSDQGYSIKGIKRIPYALSEVLDAGNKFIFFM